MSGGMIRQAVGADAGAVLNVTRDTIAADNGDVLVYDEMEKPAAAGIGAC